MSAIVARCGAGWVAVRQPVGLRNMSSYCVLLRRAPVSAPRARVGVRRSGTAAPPPPPTSASPNPAGSGGGAGATEAATPGAAPTGPASIYSSRKRVSFDIPPPPKGNPKESARTRAPFILGLGTVVGMYTYFGFTVWHGYYSEKGSAAGEAAVAALPLYKNNPVVFMDFEVDGVQAGRVLIQLRRDIVPVSAENFRQLCTGERGFGYKGSQLHRIKPAGFLHGGDFQRGDGSGGYSIYPGGTFDDENFVLQHIGRGVVSMANSGRNTNGSQFFISCRKAPRFDGKYVVIGNVIGGLDVVKALENYGDTNADVHAKVVISNSGQLVLDGAEAQSRTAAARAAVAAAEGAVSDVSPAAKTVPASKAV